MATTRKRASGFSEKPSEETQAEELLDEVATEMFETISRKEAEPSEPVRPVVIESIEPMDDPGPRFVDVVPEPTPEPKAPPVPKAVAPRRHPRNIPKFSRYS